MLRIMIGSCPQNHYYVAAYMPATCPFCGEHGDRIIGEWELNNTKIYCLGCREHFDLAENHDYAACNAKFSWLERLERQQQTRYNPSVT